MSHCHLVEKEDADKGNHTKRPQFHKYMVQREWYKNKGHKNLLCNVHFEKKVEIKPLKIDNDIIEIKFSTKFLGVALDSKLTWNENI